MDIKKRKSRCYEETCRRLRNGLIRESSVSADDFLPLVCHSDALKQLRAELVDDNPPHIVFPGSKDSYIQVSAEFPCPRSYTASFWIKIDEDSEMKAFLLCRCRSPTGGIDFVLRDRQADGKWSVVVQALTDSNNNPAAEKQEIKDALYISPCRWHLIVIRHQTAFIRSPHLSVIVDGKLEFEQPLGYPFSSSPVQSQWVFGLGFKGIMSSISLYTEEVSNNMLALLYRQGPHTPSLSHSVVGVPQSSFDTGHIMLGTLIAKGPLASASSKVTAAFCITPQHLLPAANLFQVWAGKQNVDHIEMTMHFPDEHSVEDHPLIPTIAGSCSTSLVDGIDLLPSCAATWSAAGGCSLAVYLISQYVTAANAQLSAEESASAGITTSSKAVDIALVKESMLLLADLVRASGDLKEQFVQTHGFHLVGRSLAEIKNKYHRYCKVTVFL